MDVKDFLNGSENRSRNLMLPPPPGFSRSCVQNGNSPEVPSKLNESRIRSDNKKFTSQLELEVCGKAKEAGKHPSYVSLVLTLVHNYNIDINKPVLGGRLLRVPLRPAPGQQAGPREDDQAAAGLGRGDEVRHESQHYSALVQETRHLPPQQLLQRGHQVHEQEEGEEHHERQDDAQLGCSESWLHVIL